MTFFTKKLLIVFCLIGASTWAVAQENTFKAATDKLEGLLGLEVNEIKPSPVDGLLQVLTNRGLFYVSKDGKYFVQGRVFNIDDRMLNETEEALSSVRLDGVKRFEGSMIEFKAQDEKYAVTVFTDITCGYCRKLHNEIEEYNKAGITVRYLAFPRAGLNSQPYEDMISVWCSSNQKAALTEAKNGSSVRDAKCDEQQVAQQYMFGQQVGVNGTPAIILQDGSLVPGYQPAGQLLKALEQITL
jgi:thiol:disulfide interchange protein DsbC